MEEAMPPPKGILRPGLARYNDGFVGLLPIWTVEPDISIIRKIVRQELRLPKDAQCDVELLARGSLNKLYAVQTTAVAYVIHVWLLIHPKLKTMTLNATMGVIAEYTDAAVPRMVSTMRISRMSLVLSGC
ncbi:hypothetical protein K469DRAFT_247802 [Zopfia rhizophila CBS 207.26]|uniref:Uncharacterized protein n=1 Tax=Zopfia rhizophila CBS 207.26 TaxID=1314779 RepID=A0A6A6DT76_9PEZI|nr:hypothetical protein K469DRAFT_247802 [Zopfia rhizophila CBS 207.26]